MSHPISSKLLLIYIQNIKHTLLSINRHRPNHITLTRIPPLLYHHIWTCVCCVLWREGVRLGAERLMGKGGGGGRAGTRDRDAARANVRKKNPQHANAAKRGSRIHERKSKTDRKKSGQVQQTAAGHPPLWGGLSLSCTFKFSPSQARLQSGRKGHRAGGLP